MALSPTKDVIDFRSDTVTQPTAAMREAMAAAPVGDDVYGEDPTCNELEAAIAAELGMPAALFTPSGTMANQLAIALQTRPGDTVLCEEASHCYVFESGAAARLASVQFDLIPAAEGLTADSISKYFRPDMLQTSPTTMLVAENSHTLGFGRTTSPKQTAAITEAARKLNMITHLDGARLWNAAEAEKVSLKDLTAGFTTVSIAFSKGLGAPVGSALLGPKVLIDRARKERRRWGGGMRQAGIIAAGALYALKHHRGQIAKDHAHLAQIATSLKPLHDAQRIALRLPPKPTNLLYWDLLGADAPARVAATVEKAKSRGVLLTNMGKGRIRLVTHLGIEPHMIEPACSVLGEILSS